jgi:hypothetical protein
MQPQLENKKKKLDYGTRRVPFATAMGTSRILEGKRWRAVAWLSGGLGCVVGGLAGLSVRDMAGFIGQGQMNRVGRHGIRRIH